MGGCASRPKDLDGEAPEDLPHVETVAPSHAAEAATESNAKVEEADKEEAQVEPEEPKTEVAVVEVSEQKAETTTKDTPNAEDDIEKTVEKVEVEKEEAKPDDKPSQS